MKKVACHHCKQQHFLDACSEFSSLESVDERFEIVGQNGLCFRCLRPGHVGRECPRPKKQCGKNGCKSSHHSMIHEASRLLHITEASRDSTKAVRALRLVSQKPGIDRTMTLINIVPVKLKDGSKSVSTYVMIDPRAEVTLIRRDVAERLDLPIRPSRWATESWRVDEPAFQAFAIDLTISNNQENFHLGVENPKLFR